MTFSGAVTLQEYMVPLFLHCQTLQRLIFQAGMWLSRMGFFHSIFPLRRGHQKKDIILKTPLLSANNRLTIASGKLSKRKEIVPPDFPRQSGLVFAISVSSEPS